MLTNQSLMAQSDAKSMVWVVEQNPLAAAFLLQVLERDGSISAGWIDGGLPCREELGVNPHFVLDNVGLGVPIAEYIRRLSSQLDEKARYVVLDRHPDLDHTCHLMSLGIHGFLVHEQVQESLLLALQCVRNGGMWFDSRVLQKYARMSKTARYRGTMLPKDQQLTLREEQILHLTRERLSNKEIAAILNIEISTVKFHLSHIFSKLEVASRSDLWQDVRAHRAQYRPDPRFNVSTATPAPARFVD